VLLIGEGPGIAEDLIGRPFVGKSGKQILRPVLKEIMEETAPFTYYLI